MPGKDKVIFSLVRESMNEAIFCVQSSYFATTSGKRYKGLLGNFIFFPLVPEVGFSTCNLSPRGPLVILALVKPSSSSS